MKPATNSLAKKKHAIPHVYIILLIVILLATVLTYIVPAGQFDRETVDNVKMVIPGTYHRIDQTPVNLFDMFVAIPQGFVSMANIVILIYMCVAGMGILTSTGALERVFGSFISADHFLRVLLRPGRPDRFRKLSDRLHPARGYAVPRRRL